MKECKIVEYKNLTVAILNLQGAVSEHQKQLTALGCKVRLIKKAEQLVDCDALIIPGGESTAIKKLMLKNGLIEAIVDFAKKNKLILGTCAGMILLANKIVGEDSHLNLIEITVARNAFGRQIQSFETNLKIKGIADEFPAVFIRAPVIVDFSDNVEILASFENQAVLARQNNIFACSFHPELTNNNSLLKLFLSYCNH